MSLEEQENRLINIYSNPTFTFTCQNCNKPVETNPGSHNTICPKCGSTYSTRQIIISKVKGEIE